MDLFPDVVELVVVGVAGEMVVRMLFQRILGAEKRVETADEEDAVLVIHDAQLIRCHKLTACLVVAETVAALLAVAAAVVDASYGLFAQKLGEVLQSRGI